MTNPPFTFAIDWLSGVFPVEADGEVDGHPWYFRGKGKSFQFVVSLAAPIAPIDLSLHFDATTGLRLHGTELDVGYQPAERIRAIIAWAAQQFHVSETLGELVLCCATCPDAADLSDRLAPHGFSLSFSMPGEGAQSQGNIPALPAQYHYRAADDSEVLFLAGRDRVEPDLPAHAARFWFTQGDDPIVFRRVIDAVTRLAPVIAPRSFS